MAYEDATMEWIDGNLGSQLTMKYPAVYMMEPGAHGEILSIAFAGKGQHQDAGGQGGALCPEHHGRIISKSISQERRPRQLPRSGQGRQGRARLEVERRLRRADSRRGTAAATPTRTSRSTSTNVDIGHEASVSKIGEEQLFYLMSRGLSEAEASAMIVNGFIEPLVKELPMEYAVEMNRLIQLQMEGSVG